MFEKLKKQLSIRNIALIIFAWFLLHSIVIITDGLISNKSKTDCLLILGNKVNEDGTPSDQLTARLDCALNIWKTIGSPKIIVSGGTGKEGQPEAIVMKKYLVRFGIPDSMISTDNNGINTRKSMDFTLDFMNTNQLKKITVVSQYFHISRAKMLLKKKSNLTVYSCSPVYFKFDDFYSVPREFVAFYANLFSY